jgi:uncharacterized protein (DUF1778 family)
MTNECLGEVDFGLQDCHDFGFAHATENGMELQDKQRRLNLTEHELEEILVFLDQVRVRQS